MEQKPLIDASIRAFIDSAADIIVIRTIGEGKILEANTAAQRALGYTRKELIGRKVHDLYYDDKDQTHSQGFSLEVLQKGSGYLMTTLKTKSGAPLEVEVRGSLLDLRGTQALFSISREVGGDIQNRRRSLSLYEAFRRSNDVMFYCDRNGVILDVNESFTRVYGFTRQEAIGKTPRLLRSSHSSKELYDRMWRDILDPHLGFWRGEIVNRAKDGREIPFILTITAVRDAAGVVVGYVSNAFDLSEQIALRSKLAHTEALAALGEMAAVVAHEIRNPLGSIVMAAKQLGGGKLPSGDKETILKLLREESQRINETLSNFLAFARPRELRIERGDLNTLVSDVTEVVKSNGHLLRGIKVRINADESLEPFAMDSDQIRQVVWNLVLNAIQAMGDTGTLTLETGHAKGFAYFRVRDTGPGVPKEAVERIFKPFHTTKRQGTGLGLSIAQRIVKAHGGRIEVESRPGKGAAFTAYLPSVKG